MEYASKHFKFDFDEDKIEAEGEEDSVNELDITENKVRVEDSRSEFSKIEIDSSDENERSNINYKHLIPKNFITPLSSRRMTEEVQSSNGELKLLSKNSNASPHAVSRSTPMEYKYKDALGT